MISTNWRAQALECVGTEDPGVRGSKRRRRLIQLGTATVHPPGRAEFGGPQRLGVRGRAWPHSSSPHRQHSVHASYPRKQSKRARKERNLCYNADRTSGGGAQEKGASPGSTLHQGTTAVFKTGNTHAGSKTHMLSGPATDRALVPLWPSSVFHLSLLCAAPPFSISQFRESHFSGTLGLRYRCDPVFSE